MFVIPLMATLSAIGSIAILCRSGAFSTMGFAIDMWQRRFGFKRGEGIGTEVEREDGVRGFTVDMDSKNDIGSYIATFAFIFPEEGLNKYVGKSFTMMTRSEGDFLRSIIVMVKKNIDLYKQMSERGEDAAILAEIEANTRASVRVVVQFLDSFPRERMK